MMNHTYWVNRAAQHRNETLEWENSNCKPVYKGNTSSACVKSSAEDIDLFHKPNISGSSNCFPEMLTKCMENLSSNIEKLVTKQKLKPLPDFNGDIHEFPFWLSEFQHTTFTEKRGLVKITK